MVCYHIYIVEFLPSNLIKKVRYPDESCWSLSSVRHGKQVSVSLLKTVGNVWNENEDLWMCILFQDSVLFHAAKQLTYWTRDLMVTWRWLWCLLSIRADILLSGRKASTLRRNMLLCFSWRSMEATGAFETSVNLSRIYLATTEQTVILMSFSLKKIIMQVKWRHGAG